MQIIRNQSEFPKAAWQFFHKVPTNVNDNNRQKVLTMANVMKRTVILFILPLVISLPDEKMIMTNCRQKCNSSTVSNYLQLFSYHLFKSLT